MFEVCDACEEGFHGDCTRPNTCACPCNGPEIFYDRDEEDLMGPTAAELGEEFELELNEILKQKESSNG